MKPRTHLEAVTAWVSDLANLTAGTAPLSDSKQKVGAAASLLADAFAEDAVFCRDSLMAVAKDCTFFPGFGLLHTALTAWWKENRPAVLLPGPDGLDAAAALTADERALIRAWFNMRPGYNEVQRATSLATTRAISPRAFEWLADHDGECARIALAHNWPIARVPQPTPEEIAHMAEVVRDTTAVLSELGQRKRMFTPGPRPPSDEHYAEAMAEVQRAADAFAARPVDRPAPLSPEVLEAVRAENPAIQRARAFAAELRGETVAVPPVPPGQGGGGAFPARDDAADPARPPLRIVAGADWSPPWNEDEPC